MKKRFALILASTLLISAMTTVGFANVSLTPDQITQIQSMITSGDRSITSYVTTDSSRAGSSAIVVGNTTYYINNSVDQDQLNSLLTTASSNNAGLSEVQSTVRDFSGQLHITADTGNAATMLEGFVPVLSLALGVIVTLITIFMTVFSAFDIAYIAFPVFRNKCEDAKINGGAMAKTKANGETSLRFVTDDAQYAVQQGSVESGKSPWTIYFKKRVMSYIMLAIILFILMTGNITLITDIAVKVVSGIMNVLGTLAA